MSEQTFQPQSRQETELKLIAKAWDDENFKQELLSNPKAVFEREIGQTVPENFEVTVVEETPNHIYMVLPPNPPGIESSEELSDEALEAVAGGWVVVYQTGDKTVVIGGGSGPNKETEENTSGEGYGYN